MDVEGCALKARRGLLLETGGKPRRIMSCSFTESRCGSNELGHLAEEIPKERVEERLGFFLPFMVTEKTFSHGPGLPGPSVSFLRGCPSGRTLSNRVVENHVYLFRGSNMSQCSPRTKTLLI